MRARAPHPARGHAQPAAVQGHHEGHTDLEAPEGGQEADADAGGGAHLGPAARDARV